MNPSGDIYAHRRAQERERRVREAKESSEARRARRGRFSGPFYAEVEEVLHAAGCVEVRCSITTHSRGVGDNGRSWLRYYPGIVTVRAEGFSVALNAGRLSPPPPLRDDQVCEILQQAERILRDTHLYRAEVAWNREPPVLYVATIPAMVGFGL